MALPAEVRNYNELLGLKGSRGVMVAVSPHGFFEAKLKFGENTHRVLLPVATTVIIFREAEVDYMLDVEVERTHVFDVGRGGIGIAGALIVGHGQGHLIGTGRRIGVGRHLSAAGSVVAEVPRIGHDTSTVRIHRTRAIEPHR